MEKPKNKTNDQLIYIIQTRKDNSEAGAQLLKQNPSNEDLRYIIEYTNKRNEAGVQLLKQNPSNSDLLIIIEYTNKKSEAWEQLLKQAPSIIDLFYIIQYCSEVRALAHIELLIKLGIETVPDEMELIKKIADKVLENPSKLDMNNWHCGTMHCIAGWATIISREAKEIEWQYDTRTAGYAVLPNFAKYFSLSTKKTLELLKIIK